MNFFKPYDFGPLFSTDMAIAAAKEANAKLELEGKVVYGGTQMRLPSLWSENKDCLDHKNRAFLINIEPIKVCAHPKENVKLETYNSRYPDGFERSEAYFCVCGAKLKPTAFEEV